jgi:hypothetical protein
MERSQLCGLPVFDRIRWREHWTARGVLLSVLPWKSPQMDHMRCCTGCCIGERDLRSWIRLRSHGWGAIERPDVLRQLSCADTVALRYRNLLLLGRGSTISSRPWNAGSTLTSAEADREWITLNPDVTLE